MSGADGVPANEFWSQARALLGALADLVYCAGGSLADGSSHTFALDGARQQARRLVNPRLVTDPPPYGPNPVLGGPRDLLVDFDTVAPAERVRAAST
jgi:hypothetical protein